jgi:crossover junction endodeoxyribonuclease RusA
MPTPASGKSPAASRPASQHQHRKVTGRQDSGGDEAVIKHTVFEKKLGRPGDARQESAEEANATFADAKKKVAEDSGYNTAQVSKRVAAEMKDTVDAERKKAAQMALIFGVDDVEEATGPVEVTLELYPHRPQDWAKRAKVDPLWWDLSVQCIDLDNARKVLWDALKGIAFTDDKMIRKDPGEIMIPDGEARVVVTVKPYERAHPQAVLFGGDYKPAEHQGQPDGRNWRERVEEARYPF